jgi:hypothetical protein
MVTRLHVCDALAYRLDDPGTLVPEDDGEGTFRVLSGKCVRIWGALAKFIFSHFVLAISWREFVVGNEEGSGLFAYRYGRHQCSISGCELRVLVVARPRHLRW